MTDRGSGRVDRRLSAALVVVVMGMAACQLPRTPLERAEREVRHGRLVPALVLLDAVPPADPEYVNARSLAAAVERRIRAAQDLVSRGLALRAEWRDDEALASFQAALAVWPNQPEAGRLITATQARLTHVAEATPRHDAPAGDVAVTRPITSEVGNAPQTVITTIPAAPIGETGSAPVAMDETAAVAGRSEPPASRGDVAVVAEDAPDATPDGDVGVPPVYATTPISAAELASGLEMARAALARGAFDDATRSLEKLRAVATDRKAIDDLYVSVLHQRALLLYGKGDVRAAIQLWEQVLRVDADHRAAQDFVRAARAEEGRADPAASGTGRG